jgi:ABC-type siderophore export system fused ATPase/permease subunit
MKLYLRWMLLNIQIEKFSEVERDKLRALLKKRLLTFLAIYLTIIALSVFIMIYFNTYATVYYIANNLEVINVVFVVIIALCGRLLVAEIMEFGKEVKATEKKVVITKITGRKGNQISIGNKRFSVHDFIIDNSDFHSLQVGDSVRIELSTKSNTFFSIKKI